MASANSTQRTATISSAQRAATTSSAQRAAGDSPARRVTSDSARRAAQTLFSHAKAEIGKGGDYMPRIRGHRSYHEAMGLISNVDEIVARAEAVMAAKVIEAEIVAHYRELAESYWQSRNFDIPVMRENRTAEAYESLEMTRTYLNAVYPTLFAAYMAEKGENGFRRHYARSLYRVEKERVGEWTARYPVTYVWGGPDRPDPHPGRW